LKVAAVLIANFAMVRGW